MDIFINLQRHILIPFRNGLRFRIIMTSGYVIKFKKQFIQSHFKTLKLLNFCIHNGVFMTIAMKSSLRADKYNEGY